MGRLYQPAHIRRALEKRENAQIKIVDAFLARMDAYMGEHQAEVVEALFRTKGQNTGGEPQQAVMGKLLEGFYIQAITKGLALAEDEDPERSAVKHLARAPKGKLPADLQSIEQLFRNRKALRRIMSRKEKLTTGLRKAYLARLRARFQEIMPAIQLGKITPQQAREHIATAWGATRSRARLIFQNESTKYFNEAQVSHFSNNVSIIGFLYDSIRDAARTDICKSRHGLVYRPRTELLRENTPPNHHGCRAHLIPLADTPQNRRMLNDPARDPELVRVVPHPRGWRH